ncbi:MAG: DJ-1/PfpI family protein [Chloroflexi bacterium AL-W]|nr:DJ-1/PfpI family protein [Chloroflexi bacterium AL-N1]NOK70668.1 DJ-1/PfpI family protein [Chloroflexi bacterium AL-N10]NOK78487.1 DJ-1/PfpI family protein [Chloroflexi bacterium AL-N5]NOK85571.1 DJ-1/PfpI family protein [Chloroflexi bacterium AL-W]NOK92485.1 DJ-1/PfpI family protein [Chloroflexi bacterium AL-N15]
MTTNGANFGHVSDNTQLSIAILILENVTVTDATGPYEVLHNIPGARVQFVGETVGLKRADSGMVSLMADYTLDEVAHPDVLVVTPGLMQSKERVLEWLRNAHETTQWTTSVCAGALLLGEAGLLKGKRATTHWGVMDQLTQVGAIPRPEERYVRDDKIITAAGNSAGIDMALYLAGQIAGDETAQLIQLGMVYDPLPPYNAGSPSVVPPHLRELAIENNKEFINHMIARAQQDGLQW